MNARTTVREYYESLRRGEPLYPYFLDHPDAVKFGVGELLSGYDEIEAGLREQTRTTTDWTVESRDLRVREADGHAWFGDDVRMAWRDAEADRSYDFDTRWSGGLESGDDGWRFVGMHVSVAQGTDDDGEDDD
ncbi:nuclear transport factor 2 family protein [Halegenticoccus tardaugens]|uniref:nuclear transport factor 2 family protein n=1 Tax=Halegenticoccus tardaugens TaxID=2071624 RepID=UPI00100A599F|nr:nuclear transport factor 2 family protein [Halegenticoccus tardaugens]